MKLTRENLVEYFNTGNYIFIVRQKEIHTLTPLGIKNSRMYFEEDGNLFWCLIPTHTRFGYDSMKIWMDKNWVFTEYEECLPELKNQIVEWIERLNRNELKNHRIELDDGSLPEPVEETRTDKAIKATIAKSRIKNKIKEIKLKKEENKEIPSIIENLASNERILLKDSKIEKEIVDIGVEVETTQAQNEAIREATKYIQEFDSKIFYERNPVFDDVKLPIEGSVFIGKRTGKVIDRTFIQTPDKALEKMTQDEIDYTIDYERSLENKSNPF